MCAQTGLTQPAIVRLAPRVYVQFSFCFQVALHHRLARQASRGKCSVDKEPSALIAKREKMSLGLGVQAAKHIAKITVNAASQHFVLVPRG